MKKLAQFIKILGDANRLSIIQIIGSGSKSVSELISATKLSQTLVSFHLRALRDTGVVTTRRDGPFIYYSLADQKLMDILSDLVQLSGSEKGLFDDQLVTMHEKVMAVKGRWLSVVGWTRMADTADGGLFRYSVLPAWSFSFISSAEYLAVAVVYAEDTINRGIRVPSMNFNGKFRSCVKR